MINAALAEVARNSAFKVVVLHAEWSNYTKGYRWNDPGLAFYTDSQTQAASAAENVRVIERGLIRTIDMLTRAGKHVIIVKSVPEYEVHVPNFLSQNLWLNGDTGMGKYLVTRTTYQQRNQEISALFERISTYRNVRFVEPYALFCSQTACHTAIGQHSLYLDGNHLSRTGADILVKEIMRSAHMPASQ